MDVSAHSLPLAHPVCFLQQLSSSPLFVVWFSAKSLPEVNDRKCCSIQTEKAIHLVLLGEGFKGDNLNNVALNGSSWLACSPNIPVIIFKPFIILSLKVYTSSEHGFKHLRNKGIWIHGVFSVGRQQTHVTKLKEFFFHSGGEATLDWILHVNGSRELLVLLRWCVLLSLQLGTFKFKGYISMASLERTHGSCAKTSLV